MVRKYRCSRSSEGGLCKFCVLFPPKNGSINGTFVTSPFTNLKKAGGTKVIGMAGHHHALTGVISLVYCTYYQSLMII